MLVNPVVFVVVAVLAVLYLIKERSSIWSAAQILNPFKKEEIKEDK
jgi:hypothetical protein